MIGETLRVYYVFGDPVDNPKLRQDGAMDGFKFDQVYNPIVGYYGKTRFSGDVFEVGMSMTGEGLDLIKRFEGCRLEAYKCPAGVWTIGYGSTYYEDGTDVKQGDKITKERADKLFLSIVSGFESDVRNAVKSDITTNMFNALVSFTFNLGVENLNKSTLLKKVNTNPYDPTIADEFAKWNKAGGKVLKGLIERRKSEAELYFKYTSRCNKHSGFDYVAPEGTPVKAVSSGIVTKVRIGRKSKDKTCALRRWLLENNNQLKEEKCRISGSTSFLDNLNFSTQKNICNDCKYRKDKSGSCYGMQIWLKLSKHTKDYAFYAHLSGLDNKIWSLIRSRIDDKVYDYDVNLEIDRGRILGYSGCTGNASTMKQYQEHLHFEYRTGDAESGSDKNPNSIIKTKFYLNKIGIDDLVKSIMDERKGIEKLKTLYKNKRIDEEGLSLIFKDLDCFKEYYIHKEEIKFSSYV